MGLDRPDDNYAGYTVSTYKLFHIMYYYTEAKSAL